MNESTSTHSRAPTLTEFILLNEEIAALAEARLPLETHLRQIGADLPRKAGDLAKRIGNRLAAGEDLSTAIDTECGAMPAAYRATILAGMQSGRLGSAVRSLVETATRLDDVRRVTFGALLYPLIVIFVAATLSAFVITKVVPQFAWLNQVHFGPLAWLSQFPDEVRFVASALPVVAALFVLFWWIRSGSLKGSYPARFGMMAWVPGARRVRRWSEATTFADLLLLLVENNVSLDRALRLAADATNDGPLRIAAEHMADRIERGEPAWNQDEHDRKSSRDKVPLLIRLALYHANNRELLTGGLRQAATLYRERAVRAADWYAEYVPMLLTVGIGGTLTLCFTLAVLWPYASSLRELAGWNWR